MMAGKKMAGKNLDSFLVKARLLWVQMRLPSDIASSGECAYQASGQAEHPKRVDPLFNTSVQEGNITRRAGMITKVSWTSEGPFVTSLKALRNTRWSSLLYL
jgi:hypothetical protein